MRKNLSKWMEELEGIWDGLKLSKYLPSYTCRNRANLALKRLDLAKIKFP